MALMVSFIMMVRMGECELCRGFWASGRERERGREATKEGKNNLLPMPLRVKEEEGA